MSQISLISIFYTKRLVLQKLCDVHCLSRKISFFLLFKVLSCDILSCALRLAVPISQRSVKNVSRRPQVALSLQITKGDIFISGILVFFINGHFKWVLIICLILFPPSTSRLSTPLVVTLGFSLRLIRGWYLGHFDILILRATRSSGAAVVSFQSVNAFFMQAYFVKREDVLVFFACCWL